MPNFIEQTKNNFNTVADHILKSLASNEAANINLQAEESLFVRFNDNHVRQNTFVEQRVLSLTLQKNGRTANLSFSLTGNNELDLKSATTWLESARLECDLLPEDPYQVAITNNGTSDSTLLGKLLDPSAIIEAITQAAEGTDFAGLYSGGPQISANKNSAGQSHWFAAENFFMDYSIYMGEKAVKGVYAGSEWNVDSFKAKLSESKNLLSLMARPKKVLEPGAYRTYLAPGAVAELASMFYWGSFSFNGYKQGTSSLQKLADKEKSLSPLFTLVENFKMGLTHRFNSLGELAPEYQELIKDGELKTYLISSRSAKEYGVQSNQASPGESPRSLEILPGSLKEKDVLKELGTGLYLSNLHYLNWSDRANARITGMTRYACFWVENGEIVAPIADMRFDESLFDCLGGNLLAVTDFQEINPAVSTYESRAFGGNKNPGMLIKDFKFTL